MIISESKKKIANAEDINKILCAILKSESDIEFDKEHFWVIGTNVKNVIQYIDLAFLGSLSSCTVHPRETFRLAILKGVAAIFIAHNHPGGCSQPSKEDKIITKRLVDAGKILGIDVLDHVIITGDEEYYSFNYELGMENLSV